MENKPQAGLGEFLRSEREKRHITIEQVASATKINIKLLHALESDNYDALPAKPFVRGFVTSYTRYVGLDHREVLARFDLYLDEKSGVKFKRPADAPHIFVEKEGQTENSKTWLTIVMVGFLAIAVVVFAIIKPTLKHRHGKSKDKAPVSNEEMVTVVPPPTENAPISAKTAPPADVSPLANLNNEAKPAPAPATPLETIIAQSPQPAPVPAPVPTAAPTAAPAEKKKKEAKAPTPKPTPAPTPAAAVSKIPPIPSNEVKYRLVVRAIDDAWVKYQVDDRPVQQYTLRKDKVIWVRARSSIRFTTAKPVNIETSLDNKDFKPFGNTSRVIIMPKSAEAEFKAAPFVDPNPIYLSTPNQ